MKHRDAFSAYHPIVNFFYFVLVLVCAMFFLHPACLLVSTSCALCYACLLRGREAVLRGFLYMLPMLLLAAVINPAFNHAGATILAYFPSGNPLTLESILYGLGAAVMLGSVMLWFSCYSAVMTSDKFVYLFGRIIPALSLILSMTLRFVPRFMEQLQTVREAQRCIGRDVTEGTVLQRVRNAVTILSVLVTWSLENAVETADSMKSRGYGLPGRTAFSIYRLERRDKAALCWLALCGMCILSGWAAGVLDWYYYPLMGGSLSVPVLLVYGALCLTPIILDRKEARRWRRLRSEM